MNVASGYGWSYDAFFRNFEVEKNTEYTVSFWYYINSLGNSVQASISTVTKALLSRKSEISLSSIWSLRLIQYKILSEPI